MLSQNSLFKQVVILSLFVLAFVERVIFDLGPNVELITVAMLLSAAYLGRRESLLLTGAIMVLTDLVIGNTNIFLFTWTGFLIPACVVGQLIKKNKVLIGTLVGIGANLFFFMWTNFGVWLIGNLYPSTASGLIACYINALPFLRNQLVSTLLFVPAGFMLVEVIRSTINSNVAQNSSVERVL